MIRLGQVTVTEKAKKMMNEAMDAGEIAQSHYIREFEEAFADWVGSKHAVAVANGTLADAVALAVLKEESPDRDEVILPSLTFIAQANAVLYNGLKPVFVDVLPDGTMDNPQEHINENTLAVMPTHLLGRVAGVPRIEQFGTIEDACEALGSQFSDGEYVGTYGDMGTFSFYPSHTISTGEGGMIVTDDDDYAWYARSIRNHGREGEGPLSAFNHPHFGFNAKMNAMEAIIGLGQMNTIHEAIERRKENLQHYDSAFAEKTDIHVVPHAYPIRSEKRDALIEHLDRNGVECRRVFSVIPHEMNYNDNEYPNSQEYADNWLYVPCHQGMDEEDVMCVVNTIKGFYDTSV